MMDRANSHSADQQSHKHSHFLSVFGHPLLLSSSLTRHSSQLLLPVFGNYKFEIAHLAFDFWYFTDLAWGGADTDYRIGAHQKQRCSIPSTSDATRNHYRRSRRTPFLPPATRQSKVFKQLPLGGLVPSSNTPVVAWSQLTGSRSSRLPLRRSGLTADEQRAQAHLERSAIDPSSDVQDLHRVGQAAFPGEGFDNIERATTDAPTPCPDQLVARSFAPDLCYAAA